MVIIFYIVLYQINWNEHCVDAFVMAKHLPFIYLPWFYHLFYQKGHKLLANALFAI